MNASNETPEHVRVERRMRAQVRQSIIEMGVPSDKASEIVDLAFHGCDKAMDGLIASLEVASAPIIKMNALLIAGNLIEIRIQQARTAAQELAAAMGQTVLSGTVQLGGQPS